MTLVTYFIVNNPGEVTNERSVGNNHKVFAISKDKDTCGTLHPNGTVRVRDIDANREYWIGPEYLKPVNV